MREIKFRAWDKERNIMIGVDYPDNWGNEDDEYWGDVFEIGLSEITDIAQNDRFELMQYTGLKDKNGKEIYEGDVIRYFEGCTIGVVIFGECVFESYYVVMGWTVSGAYDFMFYQEEANRMEIIGNIYENPDLVK